MKITITFFPDEKSTAERAYRLLKSVGTFRTHFVKKDHISIVYLTFY